VNAAMVRIAIRIAMMMYVRYILVGGRLTYIATSFDVVASS